MSRKLPSLKVVKLQLESERNFSWGVRTANFSELHFRLINRSNKTLPLVKHFSHDGRTELMFPNIAFENAHLEILKHYPSPFKWRHTEDHGLIPMGTMYEALILLDYCLSDVKSYSLTHTRLIRIILVGKTSQEGVHTIKVYMETISLQQNSSPMSLLKCQLQLGVGKWLGFPLPRLNVYT